MAEWSKWDWLPHDLALNELSLNELSLNELSWVMTLRLDATVASPAAPALELTSPASPTSSTSPSRTGLARKLSNRLSAHTSRARRQQYVKELEARVAALAVQVGGAGGEPAPMLGAATRPVHVRTSLGSVLVNWRLVGTEWAEDTARGGMALPAVACYSLAGRSEARAGGGWVLYTASRDAVFRVEVGTRAVRVLRRAAAGTLFRGVVLPPVQRRGRAAAPAARIPASLGDTDELPVAKSASPAATRAAMRAATRATRSRSLKPRAA